MENKTYLIRARCPLLEINSNEPDDYITTNEDFRKFCNEVFDLEDEDNMINPVFKRFVNKISAVKTVGRKLIEYRDAQGFKRKLATSKGLVHIGYSRLREEYIYVECEDIFYRGYRVFWANLCLVNANECVPLDKNYANGNVEIIEWNRRHSTKAIKYINNKLQTIMYRVDKIFYSVEEVEADMQNPEESEMGKIIETML